MCACTKMLNCFLVGKEIAKGLSHLADMICLLLVLLFNYLLDMFSQYTASIGLDKRERLDHFHQNYFSLWL